MKHNVAKLLMTIMLLAQLGLAQHAAVHTALHAQLSAADTHHHDDNEPDRPDERCLVHAVTKCFSNALIGQQADHQTLHFAQTQVQFFTEQHVVEFKPASYHPRGPPVRLI